MSYDGFGPNQGIHVAELEKNLDLAEKESLYFFNKYKELENEQKQ